MFKSLIELTLKHSKLLDLVMLRKSFQYDTLTSCNSSKPLLTSGIPYLQFDSLAIKLYGPYFEINTEEK